MGIFFVPYQEGACCLCGATKHLTGEHKIKASVIKEEFGSDSMVIRGSADSGGSTRFAQGPKSKELHFSSRLCKKCNGARTQAADQEYDYFYRVARDYLEKGLDPNLAFRDYRYKNNPLSQINIFRYFAKLLCCHLAEMQAPRPVHISKFALGRTDTNCIWLKVDTDLVYERDFNLIGKHKYAAHGGLVFYFNEKREMITGFHSTRTIGQIRYIFFARLTIQEQFALKLFHGNFYKLCREISMNDINAHVSNE